MENKTDLASLINQLNEALEQIQVMQNENKRMREFVHDLANPLQILGMTIESLEDKALVDQQMQIERMKKSVDKMLTIITEIRKYQKVISAPKKAI